MQISFENIFNTRVLMLLTLASDSLLFINDSYIVVTNRDKEHGQRKRVQSTHVDSINGSVRKSPKFALNRKSHDDGRRAK